MLIATLLLSLNAPINWQKAETQHFIIYFPKDLKPLAEKVAWILENVSYPVVTKVYDEVPDGKVHVVILDIQDIGGGFAIEIIRQIVVLPSDIYYIPLRGRHPWLGNVLTHEFSHIVALQRSRKLPRFMPAFVFGMSMWYSPYTFGGKETWSVAGSLGIPFWPNIEPAYFTEGIAQLLTQEVGYDSLDSYRDMFIRTLFYRRKLLKFDELANYENKKGYEGELVYNHGFAFLTFLKEKYDMKAIKEASKRASNFLEFFIEDILEDITGKSPEELYKEWTEWLNERYKEQIRRYEEKPREGDVILEGENGKLLLRPRLYPGGMTWGVIKGGKLLLYHKYGAKPPRRIDSAVQSFSFHPKGLTIAYTRWDRTIWTFPLEVYGDLYIYENGKSKRLTKKARITDPAFSPDGKRLAVVVTKRDSRNLAIFDLKTKKLRMLTNFDGKQVITPSFSPDGKKIVAAFYDGKQQDIVLFDISTGKMTRLTNDTYEDRDPSFISENEIIFSSDRGGVFNVYLKNITTAVESQITNVLSSALFPSAHENELLYVSFSKNGFQVRCIKGWRDDVASNISSSVHVPRRRKQGKISLSPKPSFLALTPPHFVPVFGVFGSPLLFAGIEGLYLADLVGLTVYGQTGDRLGRLGAQLKTALGMPKGSRTISGNIQLGYFPPTLGGYASHGLYKAYVIYEDDGRKYKIRWDEGANYAGGYIYTPFILRNLKFIPFMGGEVASYQVGLAGDIMKKYSESLRGYIGFLARFGKVPIIRGLRTYLNFRFSRTNPVILKSYVAWCEEKKWPDECNWIEEYKRRGEPLDRYSYWGAKCELSKKFKMSWIKRGSLTLSSSFGYTSRNVLPVDELLIFSPGYLPYSIRGEFVDSEKLEVEYILWKGTKRLGPWWLHKVKLGVFGIASRAWNWNEGFPSIREFLNVSFWCSESGLWCDVGGDISLKVRMFYEIPFNIQITVAHGLQDPLKAPFRLYLNIGAQL